MKQYALELFGFCLGFVNILPKFKGVQEPTEAHCLSFEPGLDHGTVTQAFVQIGVIAIDNGQDRTGARALLASGGRCSRGPTRIISSVG